MAAPRSRQSWLKPGGFCGAAFGIAAGHAQKSRGFASERGHLFVLGLNIGRLTLRQTVLASNYSFPKTMDH